MDCETSGERSVTGGAIAANGNIAVEIGGVQQPMNGTRERHFGWATTRCTVPTRRRVSN